MSQSHPQALAIFARRLERLLMLRSAVQLTTIWLFAWGVAVLAFKISGVMSVSWLPLGIFGFVPLSIFAALGEKRRQPPLTAIRANYDRLKQCGGVMMSAEVADMRDWEAHLPAASVPALYWHGGRALGMLALSLLFTATALWLPQRFTTLPRHALEIETIVDQLQADVQVLQQGKIVEDKKAEDVQKQLSQLKQDASAADPDKTWEALDHIKESNSEAAKQAAEEALAKTTAMSEAETMALAMEKAADAGMNDTTAGMAAQNLAAMVKSAKLEEGVLQGQIPPELLANLNSLSKQDLDNLMKALAANKNSLNGIVGKLSEHKLIDGKMLSQCKLAGQCNNPNALAQYLSTCTNGSCSLSMCMMLGKGGPGGGGPAAPMTWSDGASEKNLKFQEHVLPTALHLSDAKLVGLSRGAPQLSGSEVVLAPGALDNAAASGGSAHAQVILPEHRQAVLNFFKREP